MKVTILNSSILTTYGTYEYQPVTLDEAKKLVRENEFQSAVGHQSTAEILTELLEVRVEANRVEYQQPTNETALIFKLRARPAEGKILSRAEIKQIGYEFGILRRLK